jgi:hypothetical protein
MSRGPDESSADGGCARIRDPLGSHEAIVSSHSRGVLGSGGPSSARPAAIGPSGAACLPPRPGGTASRPLQRRGGAAGLDDATSSTAKSTLVDSPALEQRLCRRVRAPALVKNPSTSWSGSRLRPPQRPGLPDRRRPRNRSGCRRRMGRHAVPTDLRPRSGRPKSRVGSHSLSASGQSTKG